MTLETDLNQLYNIMKILQRSQPITHASRWINLIKTKNTGKTYKSSEYQRILNKSRRENSDAPEIKALGLNYE